MEVVEHDKDGLVAGRGDEELPHAREHLLLLILLRHAHAGRGVDQAQERSDEQGGLLVDAEGCGVRLEVVEIGGEPPENGLDQVEEGAQGPPRPAGDAEIGGIRAGGELAEQTRLPHSRLAHDAHHM